MLVASNLNKHFKNISIVFCNSMIDAKNEKVTDEAVIFYDDKNQVGSINILKPELFQLEENEGFFVLNDKQEALIIDFVNKQGLQINVVPQFKFVKITKREKHPKSDKLFILNVMENEQANEVRQIVTNTLDSTEGKVLVIALPGATVASGEKIIPGKVMDEKSDGMIVSYKTLGKNQEGLIFGNETDLGKEFKL
ncbi:TyrS-associated PheT N-terminal domain-related protein TapR [Mycoplasmopsis glycophila]|nr:hypothetical protein [Mycoplasmopsis glycophila]